MKEIILVLTERYKPLCLQYQTLYRMLETLEENVDTWPVDKVNRWVGCVQGALWMKGLLNIEEEREFTRPLFHEYYSKNGIKIPETISL